MARTDDVGKTGAAETSAPVETNELAIASLFLGIVWLFGVGSILGIVLGRKALREIRESGGRQNGRALALGGIAAGVFGLFSDLLILGVAMSG